MLRKSVESSILIKLTEVKDIECAEKFYKIFHHYRSFIMMQIVVFIISSFLANLTISTIIHANPNNTDICSDVINTYKTKGGNVRDCTQSRNGYVYWRIEDLLIWNDALAACRSYPRGDLISVHNFDEKNILVNLASNNQYDTTFNTWDISASWIGLHRKDFKCPESFVWSDDSPVDYKDFLSSEPDCRNNKQHCVDVVHVNPDPSFYAIITGWDDVECHIQMKSICKLVLEKDTQTIVIHSYQSCDKHSD